MPFVVVLMVQVIITYQEPPASVLSTTKHPRWCLDFSSDSITSLLKFSSAFLSVRSKVPTLTYETVCDTAWASSDFDSCDSSSRSLCPASLLVLRHILGLPPGAFALHFPLSGMLLFCWVYGLLLHQCRFLLTCPLLEGSSLTPIMSH